MDEHVIEALGKARVKIRNGKVVEVGKPKIDYCPIFDKYRGIKELTPETVKGQCRISYRRIWNVHKEQKTENERFSLIWSFRNTEHPT